MTFGRTPVLRFTVPKSGELPKSNADYGNGRIVGGEIRLAIADGATESFRSGEWAQMLVERFLNCPIARVARVWWADIAKTFQLAIDYDSLPWPTVEKAMRGSHAAFLGVVIDSAKRSWGGTSVGDCCLLRVRWDFGEHPNRRERRIGSCRFEPKHMTLPDAFGFHPPLIGSRDDYPVPNATSFRPRNCKKARIETFLLMTDALGAWLMPSNDRLSNVRTLLDIESQDQFADLIVSLRTNSRIRNDDTTLVRFDLYPSTWGST
jgi:hypothetical protein